MKLGTLIQRLAGIALIVLGASGIAEAQAAPCTQVGNCMMRLTVYFTPLHGGVIHVCASNPAFPCAAPGCQLWTDPLGYQTCHCPTDGDADGDGYIDTLLCNIGWQLEPGPAVVTRCVFPLCPQQQQVCTPKLTPIQAPPGTTATDALCCCQ